MAAKNPVLNPVLDRFVTTTAQLAKQSGFPAIVIAVRDQAGAAHVFHSADGLDNLREVLAEKLGLDACDTGWPG